MLSRFATQLISCILGEWLVPVDWVKLDAAVCGIHRLVLFECFRHFPLYFEGALCKRAPTLSSLAWIRARNLTTDIPCLGISANDFQVFQKYPANIRSSVLEGLDRTLLLCLNLLDIDVDSILQIFHSLRCLSALICSHANDTISSLVNLQGIHVCEIVSSPQITDEGLTRLYDCMPVLQSLVLKNCIGLTSRSIDYIFKHPKSLCDLRITRCHLTVTELAQLQFPDANMIVSIGVEQIGDL